MSTTTTDARPTFPTSEMPRVAYQLERYRILTDDFDTIAEEWIEETAGEESAAHWGIPDTALNPLSSATRQLVTPGLYGVEPTATGDGPELLDLLAARGFWARGQWLSYLVVGLGIAFRRVLPLKRGEDVVLVDKIVRPFDVWVEVDPADPLAELAIWHLQRRARKDGTTVYTWDEWRLVYDAAGRAVGSWRVYLAEGSWDRAKLTDVSAEFLADAAGAPGALVGDAFPCLDEAGSAVLPWVAYRAQDTGEYWPDHWRRAMHRGALQATNAWTYAAWTAMFATGEAHLLMGADPDSFPAETKRGDANADARAKPSRSLRVHPRTVIAVPLPAGQSVTDVTIGAGQNLPDVLAFASAYNTMVHVSDGLHPSDATRSHANPTSGAALEISAQSRREFARQVQPFFRAADLRLLRVSTYVLRPLTEGKLPDPGGYSIRYYTIPLTSSELEDIRAQIDWERDNGHASTVDAHLRLYPSKTREQALTDLVRVAIEDLELERAIEEARAAGGFPAKPKPPAPPDPADPDADPGADPADPADPDPDPDAEDDDPTPPQP